MRLLVVSILVAAACKGQQGTSRIAVGPVSDADARAFGDKLVPMLKPCDEAKVAQVVDAGAMAAKFLAQSALPDAKGAAARLAKTDVGARLLCAWMRGVDDVRVLHTKTVGTEPHLILRRQIHDPRSGGIVVGYDELQLGTSEKDHQVRIVDAFTYVQGQWISQLVSGNLDATQPLDYLGEVPQMAAEVRNAYQLQHAGKNAEALQLIDTLPKNVRAYRGVQLVRVRASAALGKESYRQALDELASVFPNDPSIAMIEADGASATGDFDAALTWIDLVNTSIGGDAFQEAHRAMAHLQRAKPGDPELAAQTADKAIAMEPSLTRAWEVKLDIMIAQKKWADAVAVMRELEDHHGVHFDDAKLAAQPTVAELLASAEYKAWRASRN